jgi:hypothetical protein
MKWLALAAAVLASAASAHPHSSVDQQAQVILGPSGVEVVYHIVPSSVSGEAMFDQMDANGDGQLSAREAQDFARVLAAMSVLQIDGQTEILALTDVSVPERAQMALGQGAITLRARFAAPLEAAAQVSLDIHYEGFSHDWFIQPYSRDGRTISGIERTDGTARVVVDLKDD